MEEKLCETCKKSYKINYFYTHKKSKKHLKILNKNNKTLLVDTDNNNNLRNVKLLLNDIKEKIENFLINM